MSINELMLVVFLINIPFGYIRSNASRFSRQWMMAIHIPVPFVFILRIISGLNWTVIPLLVISDIAGQIAGGKLRKYGFRREIKAIE
jgi:ABC-type methionine transport system permease subunit